MVTLDILYPVIMISIFNNFSRYLLITMMIAIAFSSHAQAPIKELKGLDPTVSSAFFKKYPSASEVKWSRVGKTILITFSSGNDFSDAFFDEKGNWLRTETAVLADQLPQAVRDGLKNGEFSSWEKGSTFRVDLPGGLSNYKVFVYSKEWNELELNFDQNGKRIL